MAEQLPIEAEFERYLVGAETIRRLGYFSYVTLDQITPIEFEAEIKGKPRKVEANPYQTPEDIPEAAIFWDQRTEEERAVLHGKWRERLFKLFQDLQMNEQKFNGLKNRFLGWSSGAKPRKYWIEDRFKLDWKTKVWTVTNLVQLAERIYYIDPALANIMAGFIMSSRIFLDYVAPLDESQWAGRGEKHMIHVADQIKKESGTDPIKSDVLVFGHHGSFTSTSLGFLLRVDPNVGIISADDKSYSGSTLPDFSALFWNLNSYHPGARSTLHSLFFHADVLAEKRGVKQDEYAVKNRYSSSAAEVFRRRRRWPVPIWRTDFNDDLQNVNTLTDNIGIETDGAAPIWEFARHKPGEKTSRPGIPQDGSGKPADWQYWSQELISAHPPGSDPIRPLDPSGVMRTFSVSRSPALKARALAAGRQLREEGLPADEFREFHAAEEASQEDWTRHGLDE